jgi:putative ABC transport system substrate-binding protein
VGAGGLLSFGVSQTDAIRHMAPYVDKILKGAKPADLPIERVNTYELIVNLKTARAIGVTVPAEVVKRADRTIE